MKGEKEDGKVEGQGNDVENGCNYGETEGGSSCWEGRNLGTLKERERKRGAERVKEVVREVMG